MEDQLAIVHEGRSDVSEALIDGLSRAVQAVSAIGCRSFRVWDLEPQGHLAELWRAVDEPCGDRDREPYLHKHGLCRNDVLPDRSHARTPATSSAMSLPRSPDRHAAMSMPRSTPATSQGATSASSRAAVSGSVRRTSANARPRMNALCLLIAVLPQGAAHRPTRPPQRSR